MKQQNLAQLKGIVENNDSISQSSDTSSQLTIFSSEIKEFPKKEIHPIIFFLNIAWMLFACYAILYYVYGDSQQMAMKGKLAGLTLGLTCVVAIPTFWYLVTLKELIQLAILVDTIMVVTLAAALAFVNLILIFDTNDEWYWSLIEASFSIEVMFYSTMMRVFLVHLKWPKWQLIAFKFSAMFNCLMFLISGVYFIWADYSYTKHFLPSFDNKVHDFMLLFIFSLFSYSYELYAKITDLDRTGDLKYLYALKNADSNLAKKKKSIISRRRQSVNSINLLRVNQETKKITRQYRPSRFAQIEVLQ